jgi:hypothetical protein
MPLKRRPRELRIRVAVSTVRESDLSEKDLYAVLGNGCGLDGS